MKISCLPVSLFDDIVSGKMSLEEWANLRETCGLDGIDISTMFLREHNPVYLKGVKEMLARTGTKIVMATTYPDFTHPDALQREYELAHLSSDMAACGYLGIQYLRVLAGQAHPETKRAEGIAWAIEYLRRAAEIADRFGVTLVYEDHAKPGAWEYVDFSYPPDIFLEIADGLRDTSVKINFDTGNVYAYGADTMPVVEKVADRIETLHIADMSAYGKFDPVLVGTGGAPIPEIFSFLKKRGFDGWLCIEEASFQGVDGIKRAVENTRRMWEEA